MIRRVKYIKEILAYMININKKNLEKNDNNKGNKSITPEKNN